MPGPRTFVIACLLGWAVMIPIAALYARQYRLALAIALPVVAAFLIEYIFYLATGFQTIRTRFTPPLILVSALIPYLVYSIPTGQFHASSFALLAALAAAIAYWYLILPAAWWADLGFVVYVPAILLSKQLNAIYTLPVRHIPIHFLGHLMLIHTAAMAIFLIRRFPGIGYGFVPTKREALIGIRNFLLFIPFGAAAGMVLQVFRYRGLPAWQAPGILLGYFWVVALSEELAFRGVLLQTLKRVLGNRHAALILSSIAFGFVHIWFPGDFPNWRMMAIATVAGWFYGRSFEQSGSIRASMVTHALTVTVWLVWLA